MGEALLIASTVMSTVGTIAQGNAANKQAKFQAAQLEQRAGQERASSQRRAIEERRRAGIINSNALASAAASGGGTDGSVAKIMGDIAGEGEYRALTRLWEGEESAKGLETQAAAARMQGKSAKKQAMFKAAGTLASGAGSWYDKYGGGDVPDEFQNADGGWADNYEDTFAGSGYDDFAWYGGY